MRKAIESGKMGLDISYLHIISLTPDMYTLFAGKSELRKYRKKAESLRPDLFEDLPHDEGEMEEYLRGLKTALLLQNWMNEVAEDEIAAKYNIGPGDIYNKVETAEWLLHASAEIARLYNPKKADKLEELTERIKHGVKEELLALTEMDQVGRVRARSLHDAGFKQKKEVRNASPERLAELSGIGKTIAERLSEKEFTEDGNSFMQEEKEKNKENNQTSLSDF